MDHSTEGVTLYAGFVSDLLDIYRGKERTIASGLFALAEGVDLSAPTAQVPMELYNEMCAWIEKNLGPANLRKAGEVIGERIHEHLKAAGAVGADAGPVDLLEGLKRAADEMIRDPLGRGWTLLEVGGDVVILRRTQTFHRVMQEGLLRSLVGQGEGVHAVTVTYRASVAEGAPFDDYEVRWM